VVASAASVFNFALAIRIVRTVRRGVALEKTRQRYGHAVGYLSEQLDLVTG
jgi:hypothetical protein